MAQFAPQFGEEGRILSRRYFISPVCVPLLFLHQLSVQLVLSCIRVKATTNHRLHEADAAHPTERQLHARQPQPPRAATLGDPARYWSSFHRVRRAVFSKPA